mmetsp:Transcript_32531/g.52711  ORF Transcript_32531/g.52711 Transcript_32531/m.52711 type:complete len:205 (+) Transcript_32531:719-1333(+)
MYSRMFPSFTSATSFLEDRHNFCNDSSSSMKFPFRMLPKFCCVTPYFFKSEMLEIGISRMIERRSYLTVRSLGSFSTVFRKKLSDSSGGTIESKFPFKCVCSKCICSYVKRIGRMEFDDKSSSSWRFLWRVPTATTALKNSVMPVRCCSRKSLHIAMYFSLIPKAFPLERFCRTLATRIRFLRRTLTKFPHGNMVDGFTITGFK